MRVPLRNARNEPSGSRQKLRCVFVLTFLNHLINGISLGSVYAIIALGYTMVYGIAKTPGAGALCPGKRRPPE